jgi:hypothetical protein
VVLVPTLVSTLTILLYSVFGYINFNIFNLITPEILVEVN